MESMDTVNYILDKWDLSPNESGATEIPDVGRDNLGELFKELGFTVGAEIGVEQGLFSESLLSGNPGMKLYCVDAWLAYQGYRDHVSQDLLDAFLENTEKRLENYDFEIVRKYSMDAVNEFRDNSLDFVYIDANHELPWVMDDICHWSRKVRTGGIISGHDYYKSKRTYTKCHVKYVVDCYVQAFRVRPWFILGTRERKEGEVRDTSRSWMWAKKDIIYGEYIREARP